MATRKLTLAQLASVGEGAIGRLTQNPVTRTAVESALQAKERVEKLVSGFESLEQRMTAVEKRLDALEKPKRTTTRKSTTVRKSGSTAVRASSSSASTPPPSGTPPDTPTPEPGS
jgi:hypothetical protein